MIFVWRVRVQRIYESSTGSWLLHEHTRVVTRTVRYSAHSIERRVGGDLYGAQLKVVAKRSVSRGYYCHFRETIGRSPQSPAPG